MIHKHILILGAALLMTAPAFSATPDDNDGAKQTLTVNEETENRIVSEIRLDGNNAVLLFTDGTTLTADMRLVTLTMSYEEATEISRLNMTDKDGNATVYDLQGRKIESSKFSDPRSECGVAKKVQSSKGVFIVNGKKVVNNNK